MPIAETTATIVAAIISAATSIVTTSASLIATISSKDFKSASVPPDSKKKLTFLQGHLNQIIDSLQSFKAADEAQLKTKLDAVDDKLAKDKAEKLKIAMENIQVALRSIEASIQTSTTETDVAIFYSWVFKLVDDLQLLLASDLVTKEILPDKASIDRQIKIINKEYPPIETGKQYFQITNTHDTKRYNMTEYLGSGPGWGIVCWDMGRYSINDTYWTLETVSPRRDVDPMWQKVPGKWVFLCDKKDGQDERQKLHIIKHADKTRKLIKHGAFAQQGNGVHEMNNWTFEDFADNPRRLREGDWVAIRLCQDQEKNPYIAVSPRGVVVDHFDSQQVQFDQQPGTNNVEWDGIWLIKNSSN